MAHHTPFFNPADGAYVRRALTVKAQNFKPGDSFPWRSLGVTERRLKQMFDNGIIRFGKIPESLLPAAPAPAEAAPAAPQPAPAEEAKVPALPRREAPRQGR